MATEARTLVRQRTGSMEEQLWRLGYLGQRRAVTRVLAAGRVGGDPSKLVVPPWQVPAGTSQVYPWTRSGRVVLSPKKQRDTVVVQMDFAAYITPNASVYQVAASSELILGVDYGDTPLVLETPEANGTIVSYVASGGVIGNTYLVSFFVNDGQWQDIQLVGYLTIIPDAVDALVSYEVEGGGGVVTPPPTVTPAPTVALSATPTTVSTGQSSTLTWTTTNATTATASGGWSGSKALSGTATVTPTATTTYTLTATGAGGTAVASATVSFVAFQPVLHIITGPTNQGLSSVVETIPVGATNVVIQLWGSGPIGGYASNIIDTGAGGGGSGAGGYSRHSMSVSGQGGHTFNVLIDVPSTGGYSRVSAGTVTGFASPITAYDGAYGGNASGSAPGAAGAGGTATGGSQANTAGGSGAAGFGPSGGPTGLYPGQGGAGGVPIGGTVTGDGSPYGHGGRGGENVGVLPTGPFYGAAVFYYT